MECGALVGGSLAPEPAAMALDDALGDGQADAVPADGPCVQTTEDVEYLGGVGHVKTSAVVGDAEVPVGRVGVVIQGSLDVDLGRSVTTELDGVRNEVLEELCELPAVCKNLWEVVGVNLRLVFLNKHLQVMQDVLEHLGTGSGL